MNSMNTISRRSQYLLNSIVEDAGEAYRRAMKVGIEQLSNTADASMQMVQTGLSNYSSTNVLNIVTGGGNPNAFGIGSWGTAGGVSSGSSGGPLMLPAIWLALMTAVDQDTGTGGTEVSGTTG